MNWRKLLFDIKENITGNEIKKNIQDIKYIMENQKNPDVNFLIENRKSIICSYAKKNVKFYGGISDLNGIDDFPVTNKTIYKSSLDNFISRECDFNESRKVTTSGSTGTPFSIYQCIKKQKRNTADTIYFAKMAGFEIGMPLYYLKVWNTINSKSSLRKWIENIYPLDVTKLAELDIKSFLNHLKDDREKALIGYPSAFEEIFKYYRSNRMSERFNNIRSVITMSESLNDQLRNGLSEMFGINVCSRYSNVENGILGQQPISGESFFLVNRASYFIEIFDQEKDVPLKYGELGRIVVTDLFNTSMPIIRYDTGDLGILIYDENYDALVLSKVEGRKMDMVFDSSGKLVSSFTITNNMWFYPEVKQYQFIQIGEKQYEFVLNIEGVFKRETELITKFKSFFGEDADFYISYVNEIPLLHSGKRKKVLNNFR